MALPDFSMRQLLEAGVHFGHQSHRWNPKMAPFIFGTRNNIHIIDLAQTVPLLARALQAIADTVAKGGRILFVGTKRQASEGIADAAKRSAQYYVNSRWLGGTLTNWKTISNSIARLKKIEEMIGTDAGAAYTKKERLTMAREKAKLERSLGGIRDMGGSRPAAAPLSTLIEAACAGTAGAAGAALPKPPKFELPPVACSALGAPTPGWALPGRMIMVFS